MYVCEDEFEREYNEDYDPLLDEEDYEEELEWIMEEEQWED